MRDIHLDDDEPQEERRTAWDALFGGQANAPTNRAERRALQQRIASDLRRNQRAQARRAKKEATDGA